MRPSDVQEEINNCESAGMQLVERVRSAGSSENLIQLTRFMVEVAVAIGTSESYFNGAARYRALGQEESAQATERAAQRYNEAAVVLASHTVPDIINNIRGDLEPIGGDEVETALDLYEETLREQVFEAEIDTEHAQRVYNETKEALDAARAEGMVRICDSLSDKVARLAELRSNPDRGMTRHSPAPVIFIVGGVLAVVGAAVTGYCIANGTCSQTTWAIGITLMLGGTILVIGAMLRLEKLAALAPPPI
jgi:hypothetical protein